MKKLKTFINVIIIFFITVLMCVLTAILIIRKQLTKDAITDLVMKNDTRVITEALENNSNPIISQTEKILKQVGFPEDTISDLINSDGTKNFLSIYVSNSINYLLKLDNEIPITTEDLKDLVDSNIDVLSSKLDGEEKVLFDEYSGSFYQYIDKHSNELIQFFPTAKDLLEQVKQDEVFVYKNITLKQVLDVLKMINRPKLLYTIIFGIMFLSIMLIALNWKTRKWLKHFLIVLSIYSVLLVIVELIVWLAKKLEMFDLFKSLEDLVSYVVTIIVNDLWIYISVAVIVDIVFIIVYQLMKRNIVNKEKPSE